MIIQMVETRLINGRWFKELTQYSFTGPERNDSGILIYTVTIEEVEYEVPEECVAVLSGDTPSTDERGPAERMEEYVMRDPTEELLGKKDCVLAAREFLGQEIGAKPMMDQADYDQVALAPVYAAQANVITSDSGRQSVGINEVVHDESETLPE